MSALAHIPDAEQQIVAGVEHAVSVVERIANDLTIADDATAAAQAEQLLQRIASEARRHEAARVELVRPLNDHVKAINARFREATEPLNRARRTVADKIVAYRAEQERIRQEAEEAARREREAEQQRLDEQRRAEEEAARREREAAAREAARKEAEAREAERARWEQIRREADGLAEQIAGLDDDALQSIYIGGEMAERIAAKAELDARAAARKAKEEAAAARQREEEARLAEQAAKEAPAPVAIIPPTPTPAPRDSAVASKKVWKAEIIDETLVPREYLVVDTVAINKAVRAGVRRIPGVEIRQHDQLAVRS